MSNDLQDLRDHYDKCMELAVEWGLKPFEIDFHIVPADKMYEMASYGMPGHFSHWTYGRDFWRQKTSYDYGRSKIYELIINTDPAQAFLLDVNSLLENMFVVAHCIGHSDFAANNPYFAHTNRHMDHSAAATADRFWNYELEYGRSVVEEFIDDVIAISEHIDPHLRTKKITAEYDTAYRDHPYIDLFPEEEREISDNREKERLDKINKFPFQPDRDLMAFIAHNGRLQEWQRDVVMAIRDESIYQLPFRQTQIMNEGWASVMHHKLMHEIDPECDPGGIEFANLHSGVLNGRPGALNPYWLGFKTYHRIIERWDNPSEEDKKNLGLVGDQGWQQVLDARETNNDQSFLRNYLDKELVEELNLFAFSHISSRKQWEVTDTDWEVVRDDLVAAKSNMGGPYIVVEDANYQNAGYLLLNHQHDGRDLHKSYSEKTLMAVSRLWGRPVYLTTILDGKNTIMWVQNDKVETNST